MKKLKITYIGHSMGGMTLSMYVIISKLEKKPHYLSKAILLSPAGSHENCPLFIKVMGWSFENVIGRFIDGVGVPSFFNDLTAKLHKDFQSMPACKDLITFLTSQTVMGGSSSGESPLSSSKKIMATLINFGFSTKIVI